MMVLPHSAEDEAVATQAVDMGTMLAENQSLRDRLLRALAEAENVRRRTDQSVKEARQYAVAEFARELLVIVDNLKRTIDAAAKQPLASSRNAALLEGVAATMRAFLQILERFGVRRIDGEGEPFDPNLHEATMEVDEPSVPPGTVTRVIEDGYKIHDRLLRPARVVVSKRRPSTASAPKEQTPSEPEGNDLGSLWGKPSIHP